MERAGHRSLKGRLIGEAEHGLILFLYLWALFGLFVLNEVVVSRDGGSHFVFQGFALLNAFALTKVMLLAEQLDLAAWLSEQPKVLTIAFEAATCTTLFIVVHALERILFGLIKGQALSASRPAVGGGGFPGLLTVSLIVFVSLLPFFTFKSVARAVGPQRIRAILFKRAPRDN